MGTRGARLAVAALFAAASAIAAWQYWRAERRTDAERTSIAAFEREIRVLSASVLDLRAAQRGYVAVGQGTDYWTTRVSSLIAALRPRFEALKQRTTSPDAEALVDAAIASLDDFSHMDQRARAHAREDQRLLASDLIFTEGYELTRGLANEIETVRQLEVDARTRAIAAIRAEQQGIGAGVAATGVLFLLILAFARAPKRPAEPVAKPEVDETPNLLPLQLAPPPPAPVRAAPDPPPPPPIDLNEAADLCRDLARVSSSQQIPGLLERAARLLDAGGIAIWIADPDGRELIPTTTTGYSAAAVARLTAIPRNADNAAAAAYREGAVRTVKGHPGTSGAIVAPLITAEGCIGVMAAEVHADREQQEAVRAVAAIVAAQLATLIGVPPAREMERDVAGA